VATSALLNKLSDAMLSNIKNLFPICRSITGEGVRDTLRYLQDLNRELVIHDVSSGTQVFDWTIPEEWNIENAFIEHESGAKFAEFSINNLHVLNYSSPIDTFLDRAELEPHIYTLPDQPDRIPYVTSYYSKRWGFCLSQNQKNAMPAGRYRAFIDSTLKPGELNYGELIIPGKSKAKILISTYCCHPSLANDNLSGVVVASALASYIKEKYPDPTYTYCFVFVPETIGAIAYLSKNIDHLKKHISAGFVLSCVGDDRSYSHVQSRLGNCLADKALTAALVGRENVKAYSFLERGSDERQYCAPGVDLPVCGFCRSKYTEYPEYHTDADNLDLISRDGLKGALTALTSIVDAFEFGLKNRISVLGEPQLGRRNLYPTLSNKNSLLTDVRMRTNIIAYLDGKHDPFDISIITGTPLGSVVQELVTLREHGLIAAD
jgi:aminopeptidase-like protein